ncbi:MAG TPA: hypothetical protein VF469_30835, partial [Kofleriaceae bacterium]
VLVVTAWRYAATALGRRGLGCVAFAGLVLWWVVSMLGFRIHRSYLPPVGQSAAYASMMKVVDPPPGVPLVPDAYDVADPYLAGYLGSDQWQCRCYVDPGGARACDHQGLGSGETALLVRGDRGERDLERRVAPAAATCTAGALPAACSLDDPDPAPPDVFADRPPAVATWHAPPALYDNGTTWDAATGAVGVATYLFADDPEYVEVEVRGPHGPADPGLAPAVRARIGREELPRVAIASTARGVRLRFAGPRRARDRHGLQVIFLAFGPPDRIGQPTSGYSLLRVAWRDPPGAQVSAMQTR